MQKEKKIVFGFLCIGMLIIGIILGVFSMNILVSADTIQENLLETETAVKESIPENNEQVDINLNAQEIKENPTSEQIEQISDINEQQSSNDLLSITGLAEHDQENLESVTEVSSEEMTNDSSEICTLENTTTEERTLDEASVEVETEPVAETLYVQTATLAVRPAKGSTDLLGLLNSGTQITGYRDGAWIRFTYKGKTAYVAAKFTDVTSPPMTTVYVQTRSLAVRPAKNSTTLLGLLRRGTQITGHREGGWIRFTYKGQTAYVAAKFTDVKLPAIAETLYVQTATLAVRPAKGSTDLFGLLSRGTQILGYREGAWIRFAYKGQTAYVAAKFTDVKPLPTTTCYIKSRTLAVRPAKNSQQLLGTLPRGTKINGYFEGAWIKFTYKGKTAYVATKFTDVKLPSMTTLYIKSRTLAVRPAKNSQQRLGLLKKGTKIYGYNEGAWIRFIYNGKTAYVATKFTSCEVVDIRTGNQKLNMVLNEARKWIGTNERNMGHKYIIDTYNNQPNLPRGMKVGYGDHWCDVFVSFIGIQTNTTDIIGSEAYVPYHMQFFMNKGQWIEDGTITPRPGDLAFFNWDVTRQPNNALPGHVSIVESVHDGYFYSIDGNTFPEVYGIGYVERRRYGIGEGVIRGFARPRYV